MLPDLRLLPVYLASVIARLLSAAASPVLPGAGEVLLDLLITALAAKEPAAETPMAAAKVPPPTAPPTPAATTASAILWAPSRKDFAISRGQCMF